MSMFDESELSFFGGISFLILAILFMSLLYSCSRASDDNETKIKIERIKAGCK